MEMMLDSGSSVSLIQEESIPYNAGIVKVRPAPRSQLVTASGEKLKIIDYVSASVQLGEWHIDHNFFVVPPEVTFCKEGNLCWTLLQHQSRSPRATSRGQNLSSRKRSGTPLPIGRRYTK